LTVSELVLPLVVEERVVAVLDFDSIVPADFSQVDVEGFKPLLEAIQNAWMSWE
jgi:putative methionine-R-sulfoxide reductase with GAF domain